MLAEERLGGPLEPSETLPDNKAASFARAFAKIIESGDSGRGLLQARFLPVHTTRTCPLPCSLEARSLSLGCPSEAAMQLEHGHAAGIHPAGLEIKARYLEVAALSHLS